MRSVIVRSENRPVKTFYSFSSAGSAVAENRTIQNQLAFFLCSSTTHISSSMVPGLHCSNEGWANKPSRGAFAPRTARELNVNVAATRGAPTEPSGGGVCITHGGRVKRKRCSHEVGAKQVQKGGVCITHGMRAKRCSHKGCANRAVEGGVCITHGARTKLCSHEGCAKRAQKGGLCRRHGANSIATTAQNGAPQTPHLVGGYNARAFVASAIAGGGSGEIEIACNLQADVSCAVVPRSPSLCPSIMAPNFSDDNKEIIGSWICRSSCMARLGSVNNANEAS